MVIAKTKTASRNVAFKSARLAETASASQSSDVITRQVKAESIFNDQTDVEDLGRNAHLYIFTQDDRRD